MASLCVSNGCPCLQQRFALTEVLLPGDYGPLFEHAERRLTACKLERHEKAYPSSFPWQQPERSRA